MHIARRDHAPGRGDTDLRLGKILFAESNGPEHGPARGIGNAVDNDPRMLSRIYFAVSRLGHKSVTPSRARDYPVAVAAEQQS
jgi:hypothetical protein